MSERIQCSRQFTPTLETSEITAETTNELFAQTRKVHMLLAPKMAALVKRWRTEWEACDSQRRNDGLLQHLSSCLHRGRHDRFVCKLRLLGVPLCKRAFCKITRTNPQRYVKMAKSGCLSWVRPPFAARPRPLYDEMYAAIAAKIELMKNSSPFAHGDHGHAADIIQMPFHEKIYLYRMIMSDWETSTTVETKAPLFSKKPTYATFYRVLNDAHFMNLRFHRVVDIGRCPKCCYLRYKCMSAASGTTGRAEWQRLAAAHHMLQLEQKRVRSSTAGVAKFMRCRLN